jgi:negative regulator of flagellin synthesis FlgM
MVEPVSSRPVVHSQPFQLAPAANTRPVAQQSALATPVLSQLVADLVSQGPPVDYVRVAQLKQAIAGGSYAVDPQAIARAMVQFGRVD